MKIKIRINLLVVGLLALSLTAHADWLNTIKDATEIIKETGILNPNNNADGTQPSKQNTDASITPHMNSDQGYPFGLIEYPRSELYRQVNNPFDRVNMPLSVPSKRPDGSVRPQYNVPIEGKVTLLQFKHKQDDSPLLIQKHYEAWLADNGFDRLLICNAPCRAPNNGYSWRKTLDPRERLDSNYVPQKDPAYIVALKDNAMVVIGVGKYIYSYVSLVKVVEGNIIDRSSWDKLKKPVTLPPAATPSKPVATLPSTSQVKAISAVDALAYVKAAKGVTFVQVSSYDRGCSYCVRANPEYDKFSIRHAGKAAFLQLAVQPWRDAFNNEFSRTYNIKSVPTTLAFRNGELMRRHHGLATVDQLDKSLVK